jgi:ActR/RegA family two-component response regulator
MSSSIKRQTLIALDDDAESLRQLSAVMTPFFNVHATGDPRMALGWLQNDPSVAVIVVEQVLRSGLGVDVLESARQIRPDVRRILITVFTDLASIVDGLHRGAIEKMISKPLVRGELVSALCPNASGAGHHRAVG